MKLDRYRIEIAMSEKGIQTYKQLAEKSGFSLSHISHILCRGNCKPVTAGKIAAALGVSVEKITKEESENK